MASTLPLAAGSLNAVDPAILASKVNFHYLRTCVILENQNSSSVILWTKPPEKHEETTSLDQELQFRPFTGPPSQHGINLNRELQIPIHACLGVFRLLSGWFIVVVTGNTLVGTIEEHTIYKADKFQVYPIPAQTIISDDEKRIQTQFLTNLNTMLLSCGFFYSPTYDITHSRQRFSKIDMSQPIWKRIDKRFFWNANFMEKFIENSITDWILPVMDGHFEMHRCNSRLGPFQFILISRRECYRTGARFHTRGADPSGHCANFAETEQLVICNGNVSSWVQTRGSIPLIWFQPRSINPLKAKPTVDYSPFSRGAFRKHIETQVGIYGRHLLVSLIDQKGNEEEVGESFETKVKLLQRQDVKYLAFDFHEECRNNNYARLDLLLDMVKELITANHYFLQDCNGNVLVEQKGNVRTNCIDCLDRTNVVQSQFGRFMLKEQLNNLGILSKDAEYDREMNTMLNNIWTNNADTLSKRYTGVGALKTDFTRTGKRSAKGAVADGVKSVTRLYHSTFNDDGKQDSTEFLLGKFFFVRSHFFKMGRDNVSRYKALKKTMWDSKGKNVLIELDSSRCALLLYSPDTSTCKLYSISDLHKVARYARHYCGLSLLFSSTAVSKKLIFATVNEREDFMMKIESLRAKNFQGISPSISFLDSPSDCIPEQSVSSNMTEVPLTVFIGSVNLTKMGFQEIPSIQASVPRDRDLYVLGAQNCYYNVPSSFYCTSGSHWAFQIQEHLGDDFEVIKIASLSNRIVVAVLIRKTFLFDVSNVDLSYSVLVGARNENSSPSTAKSSKGSGFGSLLRSITSEVKKGFIAPDSNSNYSESDYTGIAISFKFHETSMCFINSARCDLPFRVLDFDIANDFDHVFLFGDIHSSRLSSDSWIPLAEHEQCGSVFWRMLLDSKLDGILASVRPDSTSAIPISVCFSLKTIRYLFPCATQRAKIVLHDLCANDLESGDKVIRVFDPYLIIHSSCASRHVRTSTKSKTFSPVWDEILTLPTIPTYKEYLSTQHLVACVYDQEEGYLIGKGVINLRSGVENLEQPQDFVVRLSAMDDTRGVLRGKFYVTFEEQIDFPVAPTAVPQMLLNSCPSSPQHSLLD